MNRVRAILLANSGLGLIKRPTPRRSVWSLRRDGMRFALAATVVVGALVALYGLIGTSPFAKVAVVDEAAVMRSIEAQIRARRIGSILFLTSDRLCEEHAFDNVTGYTVSIDYVDCETRLENKNKIEAQAAKTASMQGMLASFKK